MNRFDLTSRLVAKLKNEEAVVGGIGNTNFDLWAAGHRPQNFYMLGSMGLAFPIALGVALAQPKRRVFALEGDGSLLMQLGCLSTIATLAPKNLTMIVMDNGIYQITGAQPTPAAAVADIVAIAVGCGLANSAWAADEEDFERLIDQSLSASGPTLIGVRIDDKPGVGATRRDPVQIRERFMLGLASAVGGEARACKSIEMARARVRYSRPAPRAHLYLGPEHRDRDFGRIGIGHDAVLIEIVASFLDLDVAGQRRHDRLLDTLGLHRVLDLDHVPGKHHRRRHDGVPVAEDQGMDARVFEPELHRVDIGDRRFAPGDVDGIAGRAERRSRT